MIEALKNAFDNNISNCLTETNSELINVYDCYDSPAEQRRCYIKTKEDQPVHFQLSNPLAVKLVFAALDNCILQSHQQSRCDFVLGNFQKLYFVEIKRVNRGQRKRARTEAIQQLHSSISLFREKINLTNTELIAVICLKAKQVHPLQSATRTADMVAFKENYNANLMEGQSHTF
jgi:hypothetical protein